jgi:hypothetical protein
MGTPRHGIFILWLLAWTATASAPALAGAQRALPALLARYQVGHGDRVERMELLRTDWRIEHRFIDRGLTEVWERDARGELSHWKVFPSAGRVVHYTPGDLRAIHTEPSWEQLATLLSPSERARLKRVGARRVRGRTVTVLRGELTGGRAQLLWSDALGLGERVDDRRESNEDQAAAGNERPLRRSSVRSHRSPAVSRYGVRRPRRLGARSVRAPVSGFLRGAGSPPLERSNVVQLAVSGLTPDVLIAERLTEAVAGAPLAPT